jgi:hypothetical protein
MGRGPEEVSQGFPRGDAREHRVGNNLLMYYSIRNPFHHISCR